MRVAAIALLVMSLAVAPAVAATSTSVKKAELRAAPPALKGAGLRGPVSPDKTQEQTTSTSGQASKAPGPPSAALMSTLSAPPAMTIARPDALICRQTCAHSYYFCLAGSDADACPQTWSECVAACDDTLAPRDQPPGLLPPPKE